MAIDLLAQVFEEFFLGNWHRVCDNAEVGSANGLGADEEWYTEPRVQSQWRIILRTLLERANEKTFYQ